MVLPEESYVGNARDLGAFETSPSHRRTKLDPSNFYFQSPSFYGADTELGPLSSEDQLPTIGELIRHSIPATLIETTHTSLFVPPSPDPSGITYIPVSSSLLAVDSEVNQWDFFTGESLYPLNLEGQQLGKLSAFPFTNEPTGLEYNPVNNHLFVSADDGKEIFELDPGADGLYRTPDDIVTSFDTEAFDSGDPEGIAFDYQSGALFVADGRSSKIYRISPGRNGRLDSVPPEGDDEVTHFDTGTFGVRDPEGIAYDPNSGNLIVVGRPGEIMLEMTTEGQIVRMIDISDALPVFPGGVTIAPASYDPEMISVYITDRGLGLVNVSDANDGRMYELSLPPITPGNRPPVVSAVADLSNLQAGSAVLRSRVSDDGVPAPNPLVPRVSVWRQLSGPGPAELSSLNATDVIARFQFTGKYVFRAIASDGELVSSDDVVVVITEGLDNPATVVQIETGADDAEERADGAVKPVSSGLEIGFGGNNQRVGLRFNEVYVPQGANIIDAYIQFQVRELDLESASFTIEGHDVGDAAVFTTQFRNLSFRLKTVTSIAWSPDPWTLVGEIGPDQRTPNIASIIQEIVSRSDWEGGNSLAITITGTGRRSARAFEGDPRTAPMLYIEFESPTP
jgi:WD40 repeat protein